VPGGRRAQSPRPEARWTTRRVPAHATESSRRSRVEAELEQREHATRLIWKHPQPAVVRRGAPELAEAPRRAGCLRRQDVGPAVDGGADAAAHARGSRSDCPAGQTAARARAERERLPGHLVAGGCPVGRAGEEDTEGDEPLAAAGRQVERHLGCLSGRGPQAREVPVAYDLAVLAQLPRPAEIVEAGEVAAVAGSRSGRRRPLRPGHGCARCLSSTTAGWGAIRPHEPVGAEVGVVRLLSRSHRRRPVLAPIGVGAAVP
jgi:hypothetical protein